MSQPQIFTLPATIAGTRSDIALADRLIDAWCNDGIARIALDAGQSMTMLQAFDAARRFFHQPLAAKARCVSDLSYSGYSASGQRRTAGVSDYPEVFTVCKDMPLSDPRVRQHWPCHGPVPWPDAAYRHSANAFMKQLAHIGDSVLRLTALGLRFDRMNALIDLARGGWHHMRMLRFPAATARNAHGIGAHTDYGMLVIAAQDEVGGLYVRPPVEGERRCRNWLPSESSAGMYENQEPWRLVTPMPDVVTVFPGDILQFLTGGTLLSTPHKVRLNTRERFAMAYFHEPEFNAVLRPLADPHGSEYIHYGTHFTNMSMRSDPNRAATRRIIGERRLAKLSRVQLAKAA